MPPLWQTCHRGTRAFSGLASPRCSTSQPGSALGLTLPRPDLYGAHSRLLPCHAASVSSRPTTPDLGDVKPVAEAPQAAAAPPAPRSKLPPRPPGALPSSELYKEAQIARLSALCYMDWKDLKAAASDEGFQVVAGGDLFFTRWFLAKGVLSQVSPESEGGPRAPQGNDVPPEKETMVLLLRGVQWRAASTESARVWQHLAQSWTTDTYADNTVAKQNGSSRILVHSGMAKLATNAYDEILPHLSNSDRYLHLAGHSMGGTLAKLLMLRLLQSGERRADEMETHTYGSFPVFAASCGSSGRRVLELAGISASRMRNWVLDFDYVPRMMISSDPYFQFALRSKTLRGALELGERFFGKAFPVSPTKLLFRNVGQTILLSKASPMPHVEPLDEENLEDLLKLPADIATNPVVLMQTVLDHNFSSYTHDILLAAKREEKAEQARRRAQH